MTAENIDNFEDPKAKPAALRSLLYSTLVAAVEYPDEELLDIIRSGAVANKIKEILTEIEPTLVESIDWSALTDVGEEDALQIEYTRLFDVGTSGPPCPLYGGHYFGARMQIMEELVRFYNFFGLSMSEQPHELPDHLTTQLEFLHYLTFREAELAKTEESTEDLLRAQRDFVARHPGRWLPKLRDKLTGQKPMAYFSELYGLLNAFFKREEQRLVALVGKVPTEAEGDVIKSIHL